MYSKVGLLVTKMKGIYVFRRYAGFAYIFRRYAGLFRKFRLNTDPSHAYSFP